MRLFHYISILICLLLLGFIWYYNVSGYQVIKGKIFGTYYTIKIRTDRPNKELDTLVKTELDKIDNEMSVFNTDSEISHINRAPKDIKIKLSPDMQQVMAAANTVYNQSNGQFDPTLGKLINLWGFGVDDKKLPTDSEISEALSAAGFNKLIFSDNFDSLQKTDNATYINLSAIAKGYGVDKIALLLEQKGFYDYMIEIGGEIKVSGYRSKDGEAWNIGINRPQAGSHDNVMVVSISNLAVATSGNYRNFYKKDGQIFAHTISSKTGHPILNDALSVSVFHDSCMYADAYATAIMAMGVEQGLKFADKYNLKVIIFDNKFIPHLSKSATSIFEE